MDAFNVAFRIPNLLRDLFAEGAMTAAFVPTFTRTLETRGREHAWRLGNLVINALLVITGDSSFSASSSPGRSRALIAAEFAEVPGKFELTTLLTRDHGAVPDDGRGRRRDDGDAELAAAIFHPVAVAGDVQRRHDPVRGRRSCR